MDWAALQAAITTAVAASTGVSSVKWEGEANSRRWGKTPTIDLTGPKSLRNIGQDGARSEFVVDAEAPGGGTLQTGQAGNRIFTVTVRVEVPDQRPGYNASVYSSRLRTRLKRKEMIRQLSAAGLAVVSIEPTLGADYSMDGGRISATVTDVILSACEWELDDTAPTDEWIETVQVHSDKLTADGSDTPQIDLEIP